MPDQMTEVTRLGQVKALALPNYWQEVDVKQHELDAWNMRELQPTGNQDVRLSFFNRGRPVSITSAKSFQQLLVSPPHVLSEEEWWSVQEILRDAVLPGIFERGKAETIDMNGKMVLVVRGFWMELKKESWAVFVDADGSGTDVQEIYYIAPPEQYTEHWGDVKAAFKAIEWLNSDQTT